MGNFSRDTFDPRKNYVSVRLQQGVPLVDADWNELSDVTRHESYRTAGLTCADGLEPGAFTFLAGFPNNPVVYAGSGIVEGRTFRGPTIPYDQQPWRSPAVAAAHGVPVLPPLTTPTAKRSDVCYLDVWEREVGQAEDPVIVNPVIGVETSVRLRREVALRVAEGTTTIPAAPAGHTHLPLALFHRRPGVDTITRLDREDISRRFNVTSVVPAFPAIIDTMLVPPRPRPGWSLITRNGQPLATDLNPAGSVTIGSLPVNLPSGARIFQLRAVGEATGAVGGFFITVALYRYRLDAGGQPDLLTLILQQTGELGAPEPFDQSASVSSSLNLVDNNQFSYAITATSNQGPGAEIRGLSVSYRFGTT
jgi:hypothetical protein